MTGIWKKILALVPGIAACAVTSQAMADPNGDKGWQAVLSARAKYFEESFGLTPQEMLKNPELIGIAPGVGLFIVPADKLGKGTWAYTSFGLSQAGMPTHASDSTVKLKAPASVAAGAAGYGYELVMLTREKDAEWPLWILQWAIQKEIRKDVGHLERAEKDKGFTAAGIRVGEPKDQMVNLLFAKAQAPLPTGITLPNGRMEILVVTVITTDEMNWSMENGRDALLAKLIASGVGQVSDRKRKSVL
jgi:hypothetical protein